MLCTGGVVEADCIDVAVKVAVAGVHSFNAGLIAITKPCKLVTNVIVFVIEVTVVIERTVFKFFSIQCVCLVLLKIFDVVS